MLQALDQDIRDFIERETQDNIECGMAPEEARYAALRKFGNVLQVKEEVSAVWSVVWLEQFLQDIRFAGRTLRKAPGFFTVAVLTLALGIGANAAIFSIVDAVLLKPLPYRNPARLVMIWQSDTAHLSSGAWFDTYREFEEWAASSRSFDKMAAFTWANVDTTVHWQGKPQRVLGIPVSTGFFSTLGVAAAQGRTFTPQDSSNPCSAVLAHRFWQGKLGAAAIVGHTLTINGQPCTVVGIMPAEFSFYPKQTELWTLIAPSAESAAHPWHFLVGVVGLLKPKITRARAQAELQALQAGIVTQAPPNSIPPKGEPDVLDLQSEFTWLAGRNLRASLLVLLGAVVFVLIIACVNVSTLFLGRAAERQKEFGVRAALGSSRLRTIRQLLTESLLLVLAGGTLGLLLSSAAIRYLNAANPLELPPGNPVKVNWEVFAFTALLAVGCAVLFGLAPAWKASRYQLNDVLKSDSRSSQRAASVLVVSEVALALMLLAGSALMIQSLFRLSSTPLGFQPAHLLTAEIDLPRKNYSRPEQRLNLYRQLKDDMLALPGVQGVAFAPLVPSGNNPLSVEGERGPERGALGNDASDAAVDNNYFRVMAIPLLQGREFDSRDRQDTLPVAVINQALAARYFHGDPIGRHIKLGHPEDKEPWLTVVGVVGNVKGFTVFKEMGYVTEPCVYRPLAQVPEAAVAMLVRSGASASVLGPAIRNQFSRLDSRLPPPDVITMNDWLAQFFAQPRFRTAMLSIFAALGLVLCVIGIFAVVSQSVTQHRREIGVRMALGARPRDTLWLLLRQGIGLTGLGIVLGIAAALALTRVISGLLYGVTAADPPTYAAVALLLILVALAACCIPARRALRLDPLVVLRYE